MFRRNRPARRAARRMRRSLGILFNTNGSLAGEAREAFDEANQLYTNGQYEDAAEGFAELANTAAQFSRPRRVVQLHLRAYEAWLAAKQPANAIAQARSAINMAAGIRPRKAARIAQQVIEDLQAAGYTKEAEAFAKELSTGVAGQVVPVSTTTTSVTAPTEKTPAPKLPSTCPQCGGRLPRAYGDDEVECDYCGTVIRAE